MPDASEDLPQGKKAANDGWTQHAPLGRHASMGDSQPKLAERQISEPMQGIRNSVPAQPSLTPAATNGEAPPPAEAPPVQPPNAGFSAGQVPAPTNAMQVPRFGVPPSSQVLGVPVAAHQVRPPAGGIPRSFMEMQPMSAVQMGPSGLGMHAAMGALRAAQNAPPPPPPPPPPPQPTSTPASAPQGPIPPTKPSAQHAASPPDRQGTSNQGAPKPAVGPGANSSTPPAMGLSSSGPPAPPAQPPAAQAAQPPRPPPGMRELRVEDALLYLDDVKREFGDRPRVYNEFLAIMKNFKSQEVDTPGVIARVSKLFRGYNNLILGFNKFLPDGYKISLKDLEESDAMYAREQAELLHQAMTAPAGPMQRNGTLAQSPGPALPGSGVAPLGPVRGPAPQPAGLAGPQARPPVQASSETARRMGVESMDQHPQESPGLGPPSQPSGLAAAVPPVAKAQRQREPTPPPLGARVPPPVQPHQPQQPLPHQQQQQQQQHVPHQQLPHQQASHQQQMAQQHRHPLQNHRPQPQQQPPPPQQQPPQQPQQQAVEFDHAISYVTTIKRRFANDPSTYHAFLEILHTYQKEQRGIKEVLEQVAHLFQDHPDLLKEFTFFLPDAVQEQAKERLHRAAADSEARQAAQRAQLEQQHLQQQQQQPQQQVQQNGGYDSDEMDSDDTGKDKMVDMTSKKAEPEQHRAKKRSHKETAMEVPPPPIQFPQQPESYVYNSAVERQFFDAAREALAAYTRDGGQAWAEFLKCLDMYAQEILSRSEMLNFVEPLLGKRNNKLFEEFKRIINFAGASQSANMPNMEDSWYSVPLSEIDFSRCRRCTPSYRALPRDYPLPPTSERSDEEQKVCNNIWVSLPVGSEESYTFRHMRRNICEEVLFRCEDERFEVDMAIESNAVTLARLEPIVEEISQLAENELIVPESSNSVRASSGDCGMAGKRYQYTFDKSILNVVHRNSISRIYGDSGSEILDLMVKNPTVTIPLVVERLRQKDMEWRKVRPRLNRRWKEMAEHNYYGSLDHRSLTWRTTDKRAISTRTLVAEIRDRAAHNGREGPAAFQARLDKAKEENGAFYETTMGGALKRQLDLTNLPKPDRRLFTPHMSLMYENTSWAVRDAYRILSFALERGSISPPDKERCHRMWFDFLGPWFNLSVDWMMNPAVKYQETTKPVKPSELPRVVSNGDESMAEDEEEESADEDGEMSARVVTEDVRQIKHHDKHDSPSYLDHHPLPAGATVSTVYGDGRIIECRRSDDTYVVLLPFGKAYLRPSAVLCSIMPVEKSAYTTMLRADDRTKLDRRGDKLAIGSQSLYLFFRLHQILIRRLGIAKKLAYSVRDDRTLVNMVEQMPGDDPVALGKRRYDAYLSLVFALLEGNTVSGSHADGGKYEDRVRSLLGHGAYELATMDKLISHIVKNLQSMANDDTMWNLVQLYRRHVACGSFKPEAFRTEAGALSDGEQMYAFQMCPVQKDGGEKSVLHVEYLGVIAESDGEKMSVTDAAMESHPPKRHKRDR